MQITQFSVNPVTFAFDTLNANLGNLFCLNAIIPANYSFLAEKAGRFLYI